MSSLHVPLDEEGFVVAFEAGEDNKIAEFLACYGFVAVRGCLSAAECEETLADVWDSIESTAAGRGVNRDDPGTWEHEAGWEAGMAQTEGLIGAGISWTRRSLVNRTCPALHRVFSVLLDEKDLLVSHDRYAFFRPAAHHPRRANP